jgi:hypothetical protein
MTLSARFSLLHSDLNDFLFATVGDEPNGMPLSVISALTRLGVDPWEEAARLAALPKVLAAEALAPMIARLSIGRPQRSNNVAIAQRLVGLLPMGANAAEPGRQRARVWAKKYSHRDFARLPCPWDGATLQHVVIERRPRFHSGPQCAGIP